MADSLQVSTTRDEISGFLTGLNDAFKDMSPVTKAVGKVLKANIDKRFTTKTDPAGKEWKEWKLSTKEARAAEALVTGKTYTLLEHYGELHRSLAAIADKKSIEVGFGVVWSKYHEQIDPAYPESDWLAHRRLIFDNREGDLSQSDQADVLAAAMDTLRVRLKL